MGISKAYGMRNLSKEAGDKCGIVLGKIPRLLSTTRRRRVSGLGAGKESTEPMDCAQAYTSVDAAGRTGYQVTRMSRIERQESSESTYTPQQMNVSLLLPSRLT